MSRLRLTGGKVALGLMTLIMTVAGCTQVNGPTAHRAQHIPDATERGPAPPAPRVDIARDAEPKGPRSVIVGRSVEGAPIVLQLFGDGAETVLIFGGIHGDEPTSADVAHALAAYLRRSPSLWSGRTIGLIAEANPDGLAAGTRHNVNGVDLNRNFPAHNWKAAGEGAPRHGTRPGSEPETQALIRAIRMLQPGRIVSIHSIRNGRQCNNFDGPGELLASLMAEYNGYPVKPTIGYPTPGSFGSWAGIDQGIPTITLELPRQTPGDEAWETNRDALLAFIDPGPTAIGQ